MCKACPDGTFAAAVASTSCVTCAGDGGTCDDGNGCTVDRCEVTKGCVHEPMPGCADAGAATVDGTTAPPGDGRQPGAPPEAGCDCTTVGGRSGISWLSIAVAAALMARRRRRAPR